MTSRLLLVAGLLLAPALVQAQESRGYDPILAPRREPPPSSLTDGERDALLAGAELVPAAAADAAGLPAPSRALLLRRELALSDEQVSTIETMSAAVTDDAQRLGRAIVEQQGRLDSILAAGDPRDWTVRPLVLEIGRLQTELRYAHLRARMRMKEILSSEQQRRFADLATGRGKRAVHVAE